MTPIVSLVGRPNVGKSTLFNRLTRSRDAIVADMPGLTRDRHYGMLRMAQRPVIVVDTGGFEPVVDTGIVHQMARQTRQAIAESDLVVFLVDLRTGLSPQDLHIAAELRKTGKPILLAVNKAEGRHGHPALAEFHELGLGEPFSISAAHGDSVPDLLERILKALPTDPSADLPESQEAKSLPDAATDAAAAGAAPRVHSLRLAIAGRPNVGKSTLVNALVGEERVIAFDMPGTTRDAIEVPFERDGRKFTLIDTAGLRRKGKVFEAVEKFSVIKTLQAIEQANVVVLLLDATEGVSDQDAHIASFAVEAGRALVLAANKWDAVDAYGRERLMVAIRQRLPFVGFAKFHSISARTGAGLNGLMKSVIAAHAAAYRKLPTPKLTRAIIEAVAQQQPPRSGPVRPKLRYAHQGGTNPPIIVIHGSALDRVPATYTRYLEGQLREKFDLTGTPLRVEYRSSANPYAKDA
ncbi:ribosome biogenesis GTPase Der [Thiomonas bhubaneswarensis]|uniref:GTPase Der n=1 Tax=Thiomonas bhubaneswarensis TaxID=339866 RepID=A0A0K6I1T9_9BURK|nr:ribosome biogenesis GTPase Der [Thiomonas bhubaneswarensis]CUA97038.1 ribosome-associated GTPase EngA [Thiomonas bhubaneswarensis]